MWRSFLAVFRKEFLHILRDAGTLRAGAGAAGHAAGAVRLHRSDACTTCRRSSSIRTARSRAACSRAAARDQDLQDRRGHRQPATRRAQLIRAGRARVARRDPAATSTTSARAATTAQVLVLIDGSDSTASAQALASDQRPGRQRQRGPPRGGGRRAGAPLAAQPIILFNPEGRTANYIIPGLVAVLLQLLGIVLSAGAIVRERERGTLRAAAGHADRSAGADARQAGPVPGAEPGRDDADPAGDALRVLRPDPRQPRCSCT